VPFEMGRGAPLPIPGPERKGVIAGPGDARFADARTRLSGKRAEHLRQRVHLAAGQCHAAGGATRGAA